MKTSPVMALALGAAALGLPATALAAGKPVNDDSRTSGYGELWLGYSFLDPDSTATVIDDDSYPGLGGAFRVNLPAGGDMSIQLDLQGESPFLDDTNDNYSGSIMGGAHFSFRDPNQYLFGGFFGVGNGFNASEDTVTAWTLGAEGQYYLTDWTLYGQLGYMDGYDVNTGIDEAFRDAWFGRAVGRYFLDSNVKLEGELSYANGESDTVADDVDVWGWGMRYEREINSMDASLFLAYNGNFYDNSGTPDESATEHTIKLGLNFAFGIEGQKYIDRHGATLDLPMITRWSAYGVDVLD